LLTYLRKTHIAIKLAYWIQEEYPERLVFWVHASNPDRIRQACLQIAFLEQKNERPLDQTKVLETLKSFLFDHG
jgi:hypothetical protein